MIESSFTDEEKLMDRHKVATPYPLRMTEEMRRDLAQQAEQNERSLHGEIIQRLKESLRQGVKVVDES
jgi:hypothetical protein